MFIAFFSFYKALIRQIEDDLEKGYVSFFLTFYFMEITFIHFVLQCFLVHQRCKLNLSAAACMLTPQNTNFQPCTYARWIKFLTQLELKKLLKPNSLLIWTLENLVQTFEFIKRKAKWKEGFLLWFFKLTGN